MAGECGFPLIFFFLLYFENGCFCVYFMRNTCRSESFRESASKCSFIEVLNLVLSNIDNTKQMSFFKYETDPKTLTNILRSIFLRMIVVIVSTKYEASHR